MDFAWVVDALHRGLKVRRRAWLLTNPTMYLKMVKDAELKRKVVRVFCMGLEAATWWPTQEELFDFTDWEEYVETKKGPEDKLPQGDLPVWPEVNADGYARMSKDSDVVVHDGVYRYKKGPVFGNTKLTFDENGQSHMGDIMAAQNYHGGKPVEDISDEEHQKQLLDTLVNAFAELVSQRVAHLLQGKVNINHEKED